MKLTEQQEQIRDFISTSKNNLMIQARAGCGKTSMLELIDRDLPPEPRLLVCFNRKVAVDAKKKVRGSTQVSTLNSLGSGVWMNKIGKRAEVCSSKTFACLTHVISTIGFSRDEEAEIWDAYDIINEGFHMAKAYGYVPESNAKADKSIATWDDVADAMEHRPTSVVRAIIDACLNHSISTALKGELIDFDDQLYMPTIFGGPFPRYKTIMVDEYQDLSPINLRMIELLSRNARQIGVGDEAQSIYGFRGADQSGMQKAVAKFTMTELPLSISFRCPKAIVENARWRVPDFNWIKNGGVISTSQLPDIESGGVILCRYNAPLIALAMRKLNEGYKVNVSGIDMASRIIKLMKKLGPLEMKQTQVLDAIETWLEGRLEVGSKTAPDTADCMTTFARHGATLSQAIAYAEHLFDTEGHEVIFMSGHRSKGSEFSHVYHLNHKEIDLTNEQERNLKYVIDTRALSALTYLNISFGKGDI